MKCRSCNAEQTIIGPLDLPDILCGAGLLLAIAGGSVIYWPAALVGTGVVLVLLAILGAR